MTQRTHPAGPISYRWRWLFVLVASGSWLSLGCSPQSLSLFLLPFVDTKEQPEYKLFAADKELTLAVLSNFAEKQFQPEYLPADNELADHVSNALRKRCQENKHVLKIVPQAEVRSYQLKQLSEGGLSPLEVGKKFKADYVLDMTIETFTLYQKDSFPKMYEGSSRIKMNLYHVKAKDDDKLVWNKLVTTKYSGSRAIPIEVGNSNPTDFRQMYMRRLGRDISRLLIAFPADELKEWD